MFLIWKCLGWTKNLQYYVKHQETEFKWCYGGLTTSMDLYSFPRRNWWQICVCLYLVVSHVDYFHTYSGLSLSYVKICKIIVWDFIALHMAVWWIVKQIGLHQVELCCLKVLWCKILFTVMQYGVVWDFMVLYKSRITWCLVFRIV